MRHDTDVIRDDVFHPDVIPGCDRRAETRSTDRRQLSGPDESPFTGKARAGEPFAKGEPTERLSLSMSSGSDPERCSARLYACGCTRLPRNTQAVRRRHGSTLRNEGRGAECCMPRERQGKGRKKKEGSIYRELAG